MGGWCIPCSPPQGGGAIAVFNAALFVARYPEFAALNTANPAILPALFGEASLYLNNTGSSPISDPVKQLTLMNMLTAHIAFIGGLLSADGQSRPVGRVNQASEGTVSASFEGVPPTPGTGAWYQQSQYGAAFWQATASKRTMRYRPRPTFYGQRWGY
jgi:hypothetical protein